MHLWSTGCVATQLCCAVLCLLSAIVPVLCQTCHQHAARVMAMTLLENSGTLHQSPLDHQRQKVNQLIRQHCNGECTDVVLCDTGKCSHFCMTSDSMLTPMTRCLCEQSVG